MSELGTTHFVKHDDVGRVLFTGMVPIAMLALQGDNVVAGEADASRHYVVAGAIVERPTNTALLDGMTLRALPIPCTITVEGVAHACTDATADLSFSHPGAYTVSVSAWPMLDATFEVTQA